ncbi:MAG: Acyl carrier protein [Humibacillus sp.]|nr:Acyl carrier protein [Humibacillus sp.]
MSRDRLRTERFADRSADHTADALTPAERDVVVACLTSDEPAPYNVPVHLVFDEHVDTERLRAAVERVLGASRVLARTYVRDGGLLRRGPDATPVVEVLSVASGDLDDLVAARRIGVLDASLVRAVVVRVTDRDETRVFLNVHHALVDGMSLTLVLRAIVESYLTGRAPSFDERPRGAAPGGPAVLFPEGVLTANVPEPRIESFFTGVRHLCDPRVGTGVATVTLDVPWTPTFSASLGAVVPALGLWSDSDAVVVSVGLVGRTSADRWALGNFVRLEPLVFELGHWLSLSPPEVSRGLSALGAALALRATGPRDGDPTSRHRMTRLGVVFDYKRESLVPTSVHPGLATRVVEDATYVDPKYAVHISVDQTGSRQQVTVTAPGMADSTLRRLVQAYSDQLLYGPFRAAVEPRSLPLPASVPA